MKLISCEEGHIKITWHSWDILECPVCRGMIELEEMTKERDAEAEDKDYLESEVKKAMENLRSLLKGYYEDMTTEEVKEYNDAVLECMEELV